MIAHFVGTYRTFCELNGLEEQEETVVHFLPYTIVANHEALDTICNVLNPGIESAQEKNQRTVSEAYSGGNWNSVGDLLCL